VADSSAHALTAQLVEVWDALGSLGAELSDLDWARVTSCPGWPVSAHYAHIVGTESMLLGRPDPEPEPGRAEHVHNDIAVFNERWISALQAETRGEVLGRLAEVAEARRAALEAMTDADFHAPSWTPVGPADYRRFMQVRVFDCWVHEQDVRHAVARPGHERGPAAEQSVDEIVRAIGFIVGKKAGAPEGSSVLIELSGPVRRDIRVAVAGGRARVVDDLEGSPSTSLTLSSTAFTRLACGRVDVESVIAGSLGGVHVAGDAELAQRVVSNLAFTI
jgi:uncharacterized protein (TIGR03083 family)